MSNDLFIPIKFTTNISIKPSDIKIDFDNIFLDKLQKKYEGICTKHGYIKNNSIKIIKRSIGTIIKQHFNGNISYDLNCVAEICNPVIGSIIKCIVKNKNTMGILAQGFYNNIPILEIIIPKISAGIISEIDINNVNIGDEILVEVCGKKFVLYDKYISIIGRIIKPKNNITEQKSNIDYDDEDLDEKDFTDDNIVLDEDIEEQHIDDDNDDDDNDDDNGNDNDNDDEDDVDEDKKSEEEDDDDDEIDDELEFEDEELNDEEFNDIFDDD